MSSHIEKKKYLKIHFPSVYGDTYMGHGRNEFEPVVLQALNNKTKTELKNKIRNELSVKKDRPFV